MFIRECMQRNPVTVLPSASMQEAARRMAEFHIGSVLVADENGRLKGILTDRDIALAVAAEGKNPRKTSASEIMTQAPVSTEFDTDIETALNIMNRTHARRLPVTENGKVVGIVSSADLAGVLKKQFNQFIDLEEVYARH
jgi:CBS domain-containing protein